MTKAKFSICYDLVVLVGCATLIAGIYSDSDIPDNWKALIILALSIGSLAIVAIMHATEKDETTESSSKLVWLIVPILLALSSTAQADEVRVRTLTKASLSLTDSTSLTYRGMFPNLGGTAKSFHYLGVTRKLADWVGIEGVLGTTANGGVDSQLIRGDVWLSYDCLTVSNFAEWYTEFRSVGVFNNLDATFNRYHAGMESYTYLDREGKNTYSFGPFVGAEVGKYLRLNIMQLWHGRGTNPNILIDTKLMF